MPSHYDIVDDLPILGDKGKGCREFVWHGGKPENSHFRLLPVVQTRDSDTLERSNFAVALAALEEVDPTGQFHEVHRFGHWACGWYEQIAIGPSGHVIREAAAIICALEDYPILDESHYSNLQFEEHEQGVCGECCTFCEDED